MPLTVKDKKQIEESLQKILDKVQTEESVDLPEGVKRAVQSFSEKVDTATTAFTNIVTCLIANITDQDIDPRYHRKPGEGEGMPSPPSGKENWFSGRSISERIIYPWLNANNYRTAKSGWQTRTFERPRPYSLSYPENIDYVKGEFLLILDEIANGKVLAEDVLIYFLKLEEKEKEKRDQTIINIAKFRSEGDKLIQDVINAFEEHFTLKDSARLPVLAMYATYQTVVSDIKKYDGFNLADLSSHEAADSRTGSLGDIEILDEGEDIIIEAIEIKHQIPIDEVIALKAKEKIEKSNVSRYYILTTHHSCNDVDAEVERVIKTIYKEHGCQLIINGVVPTMKYYLRLASKPEEIIEHYSKLLVADRRIKTHHLEEWDKIIRNL
ncbi:hypothetical protein ACFPU1_16635 [Thalassorhabdus alkalitolerans]|uniref:DNA methyltransferase n=1 Tax=Thalassorhabdus alkalitolerans TaxID=2282697 RepID=A0ABW0YVJ3_9BACI